MNGSYKSEIKIEQRRLLFIERHAFYWHKFLESEFEGIEKRYLEKFGYRMQLNKSPNWIH